jgi:hypothetical protein
LSCRHDFDAESYVLARSEAEAEALSPYEPLEPWVLSVTLSENEDSAHFKSARVLDRGRARLEAAEALLSSASLRSVDSPAPSSDVRCRATFEGPEDPIQIEWPSPTTLDPTDAVPVEVADVVDVFARWNRHIVDFTCHTTDELDECSGLSSPYCDPSALLDRSCEDAGIEVRSQPSYTPDCRSTSRAIVGDMDGDGVEDHFREGSVILSREAAAEERAVNVPPGVRGGAIGDLDGDGRADLVGWSTEGGSDPQTSTWVVWSGADVGDPSLATRAPGDRASMFAVDVDEDGVSELLRWDADALHTGVWRWPSLAPGDSTIGTLGLDAPQRILPLPDVDEDGRVELAVWPIHRTDLETELRLLEWNGSDGFEELGVPLSISVAAGAQDIARVAREPDGVGVAVTTKGQDGESVLTVYAVSGGGFGPAGDAIHIDDHAHFRFLEFDFVDVDGDAWDDLVSLQHKTSEVEFRLRDENGFGSPTTLAYVGGSDVRTLMGGGAVPTRVVTTSGGVAIAACP